MVIVIGAGTERNPPIPDVLSFDIQKFEQRRDIDSERIKFLAHEFADPFLFSSHAQLRYAILAEKHLELLVVAAKDADTPKLQILKQPQSSAYHA